MDPTDPAKPAPHRWHTSTVRNADSLRRYAVTRCLTCEMELYGSRRNAGPCDGSPAGWRFSAGSSA